MDKITDEFICEKNKEKIIEILEKLGFPLIFIITGISLNIQ